MNTLTIEQAINLVPAIGTTTPSDRVSSRYQFVSTKQILERVQQNGWQIVNVSSQNRSPHSQHRVSLVHNDHLNHVVGDTTPRIEMFNSHNRTRRLMFAVGLFRAVCSNGLIVATGPAEAIRAKHHFSNKLSNILDQVTQISDKFPNILNTIEEFKTRQLTDEEQSIFAQYAIKGRYNYRPQLPKKFKDVEQTTSRILHSRRIEDTGNSVWEVYNRVQENLMKGTEGLTRPIKGYSDTIRVNQLLWKGAETALKFNSKQLSKELTNLLVKDGTKGKISA